MTGDQTPLPRTRMLTPSATGSAPLSELIDVLDGVHAGDRSPLGDAYSHDFGELLERLFPLCRSITGDGVRQTLAVLGEHIELVVHSVPSGRRIFDWTVPQEWNVRDAFVEDPNGRRVIDFRESNLHLVSYSEPINTKMSLGELRQHLHTLPEHPDWIPYRTSYYRRAWGFCLRQRELDELEEGTYRVVIDSTLTDGELTYGECILPGLSQKEVLISAHCCHPSMANDNLSGIVVALRLAALLSDLDHYYTYRFVFAPGTIGSLVWLSEHADILDRIEHGLVLTGLGDSGQLVYKRTRVGSAAIDSAAAHAVTLNAGQVRDYAPWGYDERQYNALGFGLPVGRLTRSPHGEYPEYHTSADNLQFVSEEALGSSVGTVLRIFDALENDASYVNLSPYGEPQLGTRGLYPSTGGQQASDSTLAMLWVLAESDGSISILDIANKTGIPFSRLRRAAADLQRVNLIEERHTTPH